MFTPKSLRLIIASSFAAIASIASSTSAVTMSPFIAPNPIGGAPVGWSYAGNKFIGSILDNGTGQNLLYSTNLSGGSIQPFGGAVTLAPTFGLEHYVACSHQLGGYTAGEAYVASGTNIVRLTNAGVSLGNFVSPSTPLNGDVRGIMFDQYGTFGYDMLVATTAGGIYRVSSTGSATQIASTGEDSEGMDICPLTGTWGTFNGWLFVGSEGSGTIRAIKPNAYTVVTVATGVTSAEQLSFVPMDLGLSGNPVEGMYSANYNKNVLYAGPSQFAGMQGDLIVTSEVTSAIFRIDPAINISNVGSFSLQPEDGIFVTSTVINNMPEPASIGLLGLGAMGLIARKRK